MSPQSTIAHYRITGKLGEGGMGTVYRATDTKLGRDVAIKVLPEAFAQDADRMARFEREARVLATLNHPNIAAIYGVEERALVMELVEGPVLSGPLALEEALPIAKQIAEALEYAHEKGVIHRDLKPANIKVTPEGRVKILDFGLAKALSTESAAGDPASSPTLTMRATLAGVIMGTAAYMSPEQARGGVADKRADIWSFGVVLYELLSGRQLFGGDTVSDTLAAVLKTEPDWSALPPETPPAIRRLLRRCLERDRRRRMRDIGDAQAEIEEALQPRESSLAAVGTGTPRSVRWWLVGLGVAALAGIALAVVHFGEAATLSATVRFDIPLPEKTRLTVGNSRIAISPDGRQIAFNAVGPDGQRRIWVRAIDSFESRQLAGTEDGGGMFWSPDSRWIAFWANGRIRKIEAGAASGPGPAETICNEPQPAVGGAWNRDGVILFGSPARGTGLVRVSQTGGEPVAITTLDSSLREAGHAWPQFLPDGRHYIYFALSPTLGNNAIYLGTLDGTARKLLLRTSSQAIYVPPAANGAKGFLLFLRENTLMAQPFDSQSLTLAGEAFAVADQVWSYRTYGFFSASENGVLAYGQGARESNLGRLTWFDRAGKPLEEVGQAANYLTFSLSRDGKLVAASQEEPQGGNRDIWILDLARNVPSRFTFDPGREASAVWSPDGSRVAFASSRTGPYNIFLKQMSGARNEELLLKSELNELPLDWSRDGKLLMYNVQSPATGWDVWILPLEGDRTPRPLLNSPFNQMGAQFSPDPGAPRWVAYSSDESGRSQVYVRPVDQGTAGSQFQISTAAGGSQPQWRSDGKELYYLNANSALMAVQLRTAPKFEFETPKVLFASGLDQIGNIPLTRYAVARDGMRFLIRASGADANTAPIHVLLNWTASRKQ